MRRNSMPCLVLLPLAAALACNSGAAGANPSRRGADDEGGAVAARPVRVVVQTPSASEGVQRLVLPGTVAAWEVAPLYARVSGYLEAVPVDIGDQVERGAELARILVPEMLPELRSAASRVDQEQAELSLAALTRARLQGLRESNAEAIPQQEVDIAAANERIEAAQVAVARADLARLQTLSRYARLRAPFAGRITRRVMSPGALARAGTSSGAQPIVELARTDRLRVVFDVPEPLAPQIAVGTEVKLRFDAFPGSEIEGSVARLAGALDPSTRSMRAELSLDNADGRYLPGMYASVEVQVALDAAALVVPSRAVRGTGNERYCLVAREGVLHKVPVVVASDDGRRALIARGLDRESRVVVAGSPLAREGVRCEAVEEQAQ